VRISHNIDAMVGVLTVVTRSSVVAEGPRNALCQLKCSTSILKSLQSIVHDVESHSKGHRKWRGLVGHITS